MEGPEGWLGPGKGVKAHPFMDDKANMLSRENLANVVVIYLHMSQKVTRIAEGSIFHMVNLKNYVTTSIYNDNH